MRKSIVIAAITSFLDLIVFLASAGSASATTSTPPAGSQPGQVAVSTSSTSIVSAHAAATSTARVSKVTKVQGQYIVASGYHPKHAKTTWIKKGKSFRNSLMGRNGATFYFRDVCGSSLTPATTVWVKKGHVYTHKVKGIKSTKMCKFVWDSHHRTWRKPTCGNWVKLSGPMPRLTYKSVQQYRSFSNVTWRTHLKLTESVKVYVAQSCKTPSSYSESKTWVTTSGYGYVYVYVSAKTSVQAKAWGASRISVSQKSSLAASITLSLKLSTTVKVQSTCWYMPPPPQCVPGHPGCYLPPSASASAQACVNEGSSNGIITGTVVNNNATSDTAVVTIGSKSTTISVPANGSASFSLSGFSPGSYSGTAHLATANLTASFSVTVGKCNTPPPPSAPALTITQLNDVDAGANSPNYCATATLPGNDTGLLTFSADFGSFQPSSSYTVSGQTTECPTYVAPTEVPAGGTDTITVTVRDNTTGLVTTKTSAPFRINPPAVHP